MTVWLKKLIVKKQLLFTVISTSLYYFHGLIGVCNDSQSLSSHSDICLDLKPDGTFLEPKSALQKYFGQAFVQKPHIQFSSNVYA